MPDDDESGGVPKPCSTCGKMKCNHPKTTPPDPTGGE